MAFAATARQPTMSATLLLLLVVFTLLVFIPSTPAATIPAVTPRNETCMTKWLNAAGISSSTERVEKLLKRFSVDEKNGVPESDKDTLRWILSDHQQEFTFLIRCLDNRSDADCKQASPCQHSGQCLLIPEEDLTAASKEYTCVCKGGFSGQFCEQGAITVLSQRVEMLEHNLSALERKSRIKTKKLRNVTTLLQGSEKNVSLLQQVVDRLQSNLENSDGRAARLEQALDQLHTEFESSNASVQQTLGQLQTKFESSERTLRQDLSTVKSSLRSSERNSANLRQDLNAVKSSLRNSDGRAARLEQAMGQQQTKLESSNTRAASLQQTLGQLQTKFESSDRNSANLRQELNAVKSSLRYLGTGCNLRTLGYKYQSRHSINYAPDGGQIASVMFRKKHTNTVLKLSYSGNIRIYGAITAARWYLKIDNRECARPTKIDIVMYQSSDDNTYIPAVLTGICESTYSSGADIAAGDHTITVHVGEVPGVPASETLTGWASTSILEIQEMCPQF
ncbi:uncharacterized protein LOC135826021 isoform X4 [Sycon ciliatum]|uniref:uncharacterized protein LOC135826021 isoform X4 n=1 Tax=Sycon ciliatum TaxID=27933 RepID=UPI0031F62A9D